MKDLMGIYPPDDELWLLSAAMCDGTIASKQKAKLESLLRSSEEARLFYAAYMDVHSQLLWQWRESEVRLPELPGHAHTIRIRWHSLAAMLAFAFMGLVATAMALLQGPDPEPIGHITSAVDCQWENPTMAEVGQTLYPNQDLSLRGGVAEISLNSGVTLVLQQQVHARLESGGLLDLQRGKIFAQVPADATGLTVHTPGGEIVNQGTEFGVLVEPEGLTEVYVFSGGIVVNPSGGTQHRIAGGQAVQFQSGVLCPIEAAASKFNVSSNSISSHVLLADDFDGQRLDKSKWRTILPFPESRVELAGRAIRLINGSHLVTTGRFDPVVSGPLHITGTVRFPTFGPNERFHELNIVTRSDGTMRDQAFPQAASGIVYTLSTKVSHSGSLAGSNAQIWVAGRHFRISRPVVIGRLEFKHDASYRFEIVDDGLRLSVTLSQTDNAANRVTVTSTVIKDTSDSNWIAFYGCEKYEEKESISELADLCITVGDP